MGGKVRRDRFAVAGGVPRAAASLCFVPRRHRQPRPSPYPPLPLNLRYVVFRETATPAGNVGSFPRCIIFQYLCHGVENADDVQAAFSAYERTLPRCYYSKAKL
jgi:hypothetical protein